MLVLAVLLLVGVGALVLSLGVPAQNRSRTVQQPLDGAVVADNRDASPDNADRVCVAREPGPAGSDAPEPAREPEAEPPTDEADPGSGPEFDPQSVPLPPNSVCIYGRVMVATDPPIPVAPAAFAVRFEWEGHHWHYSTTTDADGRYSLMRLPSLACVHRVILQSHGHEFDFSDRLPLPPDERGNARLDLRLPAELAVDFALPVVTIDVVDRHSAPVAGASVTIRVPQRRAGSQQLLGNGAPLGPGRGYMMMTRPRRYGQVDGRETSVGRFEVMWPVAVHDVVVRAAGFAPVTLQPADIDPQSVEPLRVEMAPLLVGRVVDETGQACPKRHVWVCDEYGNSETVQTDAAGEFRSDLVGATGSVRAAAAEAPDGRWLPWPDQHPAQRLGRFETGPDGSVEVVEPRRGWLEIRVSGTAPDAWIAVPGRGRHAVEPGTPLAMFAGEYSNVWLGATGCPPVRLATFRVVAGQTTALNALPGAGGARVRGRITGPDGQPTEGVELTLVDPAGRVPDEALAPARTTADGGFEFRELPTSGQLRLTWRDHRGLQSRPVETWDGADVELGDLTRPD